MQNGTCHIDVTAPTLPSTRGENIGLERIRAEASRCEGRKPMPEVVVREAKRLARRSPKTGEVRSLQAIAAELARLGHLAPSGKLYGAESVKRMLGW